MATSPTSPAPVPASDPGARRDEPLRLALRDGPRSRAVDGAWWPRSRDLAVEVADLVDHFPSDVGRISRLLFSRPDWEPGDDGESVLAVRAGRGMVKVGSFPDDDTHVVVLKMSTGEPLRLLVVPADLDAELAPRVMALAADATNTRSPRSLLGLPGHDLTRAWRATWDDDAPLATR